MFLDPLARTVADHRHDASALRFFTVGVTNSGKVLSVGHTDDEEEIRILTPDLQHERSKGIMKNSDALEDDLPEEIDFSGAERDRYAGRIAPSATVVLLEPDVTAVFPDSNAVNAALRMVIRAGLLADSASS